MRLAERGLHTRAFRPLQSVFQSLPVVLHSRLLFSTTSKSLSSKRTAKSWADRFFAKLTPIEIPPINIADWRIEMDTEEPMISTLKYLEKFTNHERKGVPKGAGTDSEEGFPLRRMELLIKTLGDPVSHLKCVHVAGTKGKGSVVGMLASILRKAKLKVGTYTSPHFLTVRERIAVNGLPISPGAFASLVAKHRPMLDELHKSEGVTHFEVLTALAFKHFKGEGVDVAIIEAGLGGARDATNVIPPRSLLLAVITAIHEEHMDALGGSLEAIVAAKCGIIKEGRPVLVVRQKDGVASMVDASVERSGASEWYGVSREQESDARFLNVSAAQQAAILALRGVLQGGVEKFVRLACKGIYGDRPLGRDQRLTDQEAESLGLEGRVVILDGAHTPESIEVLCQNWDDIKPYRSGGRVLFVIAMAKDKDHRQCLAKLHSEKRDRMQTPIFTEVPIAGSFKRTAPAQVLRDCWIDLTKEEAICEPDFDKALERAAAASSDATMVILTGSMYIVGAALAKIAGIKSVTRQKENLISTSSN